MKVRVAYSKQEFEQTIKYIAKQNPYFTGNYIKIKESLLNTIASMVKNGNSISGTMGYTIRVVNSRREGIDNDENYLHLQFLVDPSLGSDIDENEYTEKIYDTEETGSI